MNDMKLRTRSFEECEFTYFDAEVLAFWGERAHIQLSCMDEIAAYLD